MMVKINLKVMWPELKEGTRRVYNQIRPHQSLGYLSPAQYLQRYAAAYCLTYVELVHLLCALPELRPPFFSYSFKLVRGEMI